MTTRTGSGRPRLAAPGPAVRAVVRIQLRVFHSFVALPRPTQQYGGIPALPPGSVARVHIRAARHCDEATAHVLAGALRSCAEVDVVGVDPHGVAETREALARALTAGTPTAC